MNPLSFARHPAPDLPPVRNVNEVMDERSTFGQRSADWVAGNMGSWRFIIVQTVLLLFWVGLNVAAWVRHWDPYPFILMNLVLSMQAAFAAPIIMMSQNRQTERDRVEAHNDYLLNRKAEEEVRLIMAHLEAQDRAVAEILDLLRAREGASSAPPALPPEDPPAPGRFPAGGSYP